MSPQEAELGVERRVEIGAAPAELPDVDVRRCRVEDGAHVRQWQAGVDHTGQALAARLARPGGQA
jgi:hypothetical protein